jgi:hypothetical protein
MRMGVDNQRWLSGAILTASIPIYVCVCRPAIIRRGYPEIDPFWLAMPWLWIVPIILSGLFGHNSPSRKRSIIVYTFVSSFFFCGTLIFSVPRSSSFVGMILLTLLFLGPLNLVVAFIVEKASQFAFRFIGLHGDAKPNTHVKMFLAVVILGVAVAFPFASRAIVFHTARVQAQADAERDWAKGEAIWYVKRGDPAMFGASGDGCYGVVNGLKTEMMRPGVTANFYCEAYRAVIEQELAQSGATDKIKDLFNEGELQSWIKNAQFRRVESFPLKQGITEITLKGFQSTTGRGCYFGEPSKFLYCAVIPEKKNALVVINDQNIWIFAGSGQLIQSIDYNGYPELKITEDALKAHH